MKKEHTYDIMKLDEDGVMIVFRCYKDHRDILAWDGIGILYSGKIKENIETWRDDVPHGVDLIFNY